MTGGVDVGPRPVDLAVDGEGCRVDGLVANDDVAGLVDEDEVRDADLGEVRRERVQPEVVGQDGVADGARLRTFISGSLCCEEAFGFGW